MCEDERLAWVKCTKINGEAIRIKEQVAAEHGLTIFINDKPFATAMITPALKKEFVVGHLFGQRLIRQASDISSLVIDGDTARVELKTVKTTGKGLPQIRSDFKVSHEDIFEGVSAILKSPIFTETQAVHSAGLFKRGAEPVCLTEDIGRHNALDKVVGYGLLHDVEFANTFVTSTGRQPSEMVIRCANANIPVIATKGVSTTRAVMIARSIGFTIAGAVRSGGMIIYSHPERVI